jgi:hypothetical protein
MYAVVPQTSGQSGRERAAVRDNTAASNTATSDMSHVASEFTSHLAGDPASRLAIQPARPLSRDSARSPAP